MFPEEQQEKHAQKHTKGERTEESPPYTGKPTGLHGHQVKGKAGGEARDPKGCSHVKLHEVAEDGPKAEEKGNSKAHHGPK